MASEAPHPSRWRALGERLAQETAARKLAERLTAALGRPVVRPEISRWEAGKHPPAAGTLRILEQVLQSKSPA